MTFRICTAISITMLMIMVACSGDRSTGPISTGEPSAHEPWPDEEAENLAWLISGYTWAPRDLYERISGDLNTIRGQLGDSIVYVDRYRQVHHPLPLCHHTPNFGPGRVLVTVDSSLYKSIVDGTLEDWDSLNILFQATVVEFPPRFLDIQSTYRVNPFRMAAAYEELQGSASVQTTENYVDSRGSILAYQFDWGIGYLFGYPIDYCFDGPCSTPSFYYFRSYKDRIEYAGEYNVGRDSMKPAWWDEALSAADLNYYGDDEYKNRDQIPPSRISNLTSAGVQFDRRLEVSFTSPGDDGTTGQASAYEFAWADQPFSDSTWPGTRATIPAVSPGRPTTITLTGLAPDTLNYIAVRTVDGRNNRSGMSNLITSRNALQNGWTRYTKANSNLIDGPVTALFVDRLGVTWVGTENGIAQESGGLWSNFTTRDGLPSNYITSIGEDGFGNLWAGTLEGLARFHNGQWQAIVPTGGSGGYHEIRCIAGTDDGSIWCGVGFAGAARFDGTHWNWFDSTNSGLQGAIVRDILVAGNQDVWFATEHGVCQFDGTDWTVHDPVPGSQTSYVASIIESPVGTIVVGTGYAQMAKYDGTNWTNVSIRSTNTYGLGSPMIRDVVATDGGNIWLGAFESIRWFVKGELTNQIVLLDTNCGLTDRNITRLAAGRDNTLWIGTRSSGVFRWKLSESGIGVTTVP